MTECAQTLRLFVIEAAKSVRQQQSLVQTIATTSVRKVVERSKMKVNDDFAMSEVKNVAEKVTVTPSSEPYLDCAPSRVETQPNAPVALAKASIVARSSYAGTDACNDTCDLDSDSGTLAG